MPHPPGTSVWPVSPKVNTNKSAHAWRALAIKPRLETTITCSTASSSGGNHTLGRRLLCALRADQSDSCLNEILVNNMERILLPETEAQIFCPCTFVSCHTPWRCCFDARPARFSGGCLGWGLDSWKIKSLRETTAAAGTEKLEQTSKLYGNVTWATD